MLRAHGLYYERRKNYYANQGYEQSEIVTPLHLGAGFVALGLKNPRRATLFGNGSIQNRSVYNRVFGHGSDLNIWLAIARIFKEVDKALDRFSRRDRLRLRIVRGRWRYVVGFMVVARIFGKFSYSLDDLARMDASTLTSALLDDTIGTISAVRPKGRQGLWRRDEVHKAGKAMEERYGIDDLKEWQPVRLGDERSRGQRERAAVDLDFAMTVDRHLPSQPWKPGVHKLVAEQLGQPIGKCYAAIQFLIDQRIRNFQKDGVVYDPAGNIVSYDSERVKANKLGIFEE